MRNKQDSELNDIIEGFQIMGSDTGGLVNPIEMKEIMDIMNMSEKNPFIYNIITSLCSDKEVQEKGGIEVSDFISLLDQNLEDASTENFQKFFSIFSTPGTNKIPLPTFSQICGDKGTSVEEEKLKKLILKPEIKGKELNYNEFVDIMNMGVPNENLEENNINKIGINFNSSEINNNNFNSPNLRDSLDSSGNNSEKNNQIYDDQNPEIEKLYIKTDIINNQKDKNIYVNNNDINNFDNVNINRSTKKDEEIGISKKKYRHMRRSKNNSSREKYEDKINNDDEEEVKQKDINNPNQTDNYTRGRIENKEINHNNYNIGNENEEKIEMKSEKRYHRRYRDIKSSTPDKKNEKTKNENSIEANNKNNGVYSKYRRKK